MAGNFSIGGTTVSKPAVYISSAVAVGILGYAYWQRRKGASAPADTGSTTTTDPNIDPATGIPYADEYGGYGATGGASGLGIYDPATGGTIASYGQTVTSVSTNAAWAQAAQLFLVQAGYEPTVTAAALGKGLTGQPMTDAELTIWNAAVGFEGYPPQPIPPIRHVPPDGQGSGSTPTATGKGPVGNLHQVGTSRTSIHVDWNPVPGAKGYSIERNGSHIVTVLYSEAHVNASPGHSYKITVTPVMSNGHLGTPKSITGHTSR